MSWLTEPFLTCILPGGGGGITPEYEAGLSASEEYKAVCLDSCSFFDTTNLGRGRSFAVGKKKKAGYLPYINMMIKNKNTVLF